MKVKDVQEVLHQHKKMLHESKRKKLKAMFRGDSELVEVLKEFTKSHSTDEELNLEEQRQLLVKMNGIKKLNENDKMLLKAINVLIFKNAPETDYADLYNAMQFLKSKEILEERRWRFICDYKFGPQRALAIIKNFHPNYCNDLSFLDFIESLSGIQHDQVMVIYVPALVSLKLDKFLEDANKALRLFNLLKKTPSDQVRNFVSCIQELKQFNLYDDYALSFFELNPELRPRIILENIKRMKGASSYVERSAPQGGLASHGIFSATTTPSTREEQSSFRFLSI